MDLHVHVVVKFNVVDEAHVRTAPVVWARTYIDYARRSLNRLQLMTQSHARRLHWLSSL